MIKQVHNSLTVDDNSWTLKFDNFSELQNVITDNPPTSQRHYHALRTKIDMWLTPYQFSIPTYSTESRLFLSMPMNHLSPYKRRIEYLTKSLLRRFSKIMLSFLKFLLEKVSLQFENGYIHESECTWSEKSW